MSKNTTHSEPLIRLSKNDSVPMWKGWLIRIAAVVAAFIVCAFIIVSVTDLNPIEVYAAMIKGSFGSVRKVWILLQNIAMLLCIALAVTPAYKMKFWNIGAEGQVLMGGIATAEDAIEFILAGASAVSVGAMNFVDPYTTVKVVEGIEDYMRTYHVENLTDLIGAVE